VTQLASDDSVLELFGALDLSSIALLLDVDGTLIDIGPTPQQVTVPRELGASLARLESLSGGALALVSGRPVADLDRLFAPLMLSIVGGHGAEMRVGGKTIERGIAPLPAAMRKRLADVRAPVIVEDKGYSVALHCRVAPERERALWELARKVCTDFPGEAVDILPGKAMVEVKRAHVNKGDGVRALMTYPPFKGRRPVFIGDDVTDQAVFSLLPQIGGLGFSVSRYFANVAGTFESPADVRTALAALAQSGGKGRR
jgi:trehalose 6-phosphate phosphatase